MVVPMEEDESSKGQGVREAEEEEEGDSRHLAPGGADFEPVFVGVNLSTEKISGALSKSPELLLKCWQP